MSSPSGSKTWLRMAIRSIGRPCARKRPGRPVRFELTEQTRQAVDGLIKTAEKKPGEFLFTLPRGPEHGMSTRQYARLFSGWIATIGLDPHLYGTHSLRRTKTTLIYRRTGNLRAVQLRFYTEHGSPADGSTSKGHHIAARARTCT